MEITFDPCSVIVVPEPSAQAHEVAGIDAAIKRWNRAGNFRIERAEAGVEHAGPDVLPIRFQRAAGPFRGLYDDKRGIVFINDSLRGERQAVTIAHEFGHAFGLWHVDKRHARSVMNPGNAEVWPTPEDVADVHALWPACNARASASDAGVH